MELVLRDGKNELCIDHQEGSVGFIVLITGGEQLNFSVDLPQWKQLKTFIDDSVYEYEQELRAEEKRIKELKTTNN